MFEIKDGKIVKIETTETITQVSSASIQEQIDSINDTIYSLNASKETLIKDLEEVIKLESELKKNK